jgi:regulator of RNase E activity RraA
MRALGFQYLLGGISPGHGEMAVQAVNVPVNVGGMDVAPGEIIHMDADGAVKFPANKLEAVLTNVRLLLDDEARRLDGIRNATNAAEVRRAFGGHAYSEEEA